MSFDLGEAGSIDLGTMLKSRGVKSADREQIAVMVTTAIQSALATCGACCLDDGDDLNRATEMVLAYLGIE